MDENGEPVRKKKRVSKEKYGDSLRKTDCNEEEVEVNNEGIGAEEGGNKTEVTTLNFDPHSLRKRLRDDSGLQAVKILIIAADNSGGDAIKDYIKAGGGPLELLQVINNSEMKKNPILAGPVFSAVHLVVVRILSDFPLLQKSAEEACCYLLSEFMPTIHFMLVPSASVNHKIIALKLLTSVVSISTQLARDVLNSINLEFSHVDHLAAQVRPYDVKSVRVTFIHFILSFIVDGNSYIIRQLLQNKGLLRLLMQDLIFDNSTTVIFLLTALKDKVVSNQMIQKSLKIHCFNTAVLISLLELYNWLGPKHWVSKKTISENRTAILFKGDEEERNSVRECVHSLFILLCTSHKFGIAFFDRNIGTGPSCQNVIIRSLFKAIEKQWEDDLVKELVRSILLVNPDLISSAFFAFKKLFEPRPTKNWLSTVEFISQVTKQLNPQLCLPDHLSNQQIIKLIKNLCLPSPVMQTVYSKESLNSNDSIIRSAAVKCLLSSMKSLHVFISSMKSPKAIVSAVVKHLNQVGPKLDCIVSAWKMGNSSTDESSSMNLLSDVDYDLCFVELLLVLYKISPVLLDSADEWSDDLVSALLNDCCKEPEDQQKMTSFKLETLKMVSVLKTLSPVDETFKICVKLLTELMNTDVRQEAKIVLENLLLSTRLFEGVEDEVEIWLHCLIKNGSSSSLIDFFQEVIKEGALNTASYFKVINDACSEVSPHVRKSTSNIDDIIAILEKNDEEAEDDDSMSNNMINKRNNIVRSQQSLSPLVPAMLHIVSNKKRFQKFAHNEVELSAKQNFVTSVLVHSLHRQTYPERLQKLLQKDLVGSATAAVSYVSSWTDSGSSPHPLTFTPFNSNSIESKLSKFFLQQGKLSKLASEVLHLLDNFSEDNPKLLLHLCVFYITQMFQQDYVVSDIVKNSAKIISKILSLMDCSSQSFIPILQGILTHPVLVNMFKPMKKDIYPDLVQIVLLFINAANSSINDKNVLYSVLFDCKKKLLNSIIKTLKKQKPLKTDVSPILRELPLTEEEIQTVLLHLINLPIDIQVDGWFEIEALLLNQAAENSIVLLKDTFSILSYQMTQMSGGPDCLLQAFKNYVGRFPHFMKFIETDLFVILLNENNSGNLELAKLLLCSDKKLVNVLKDNMVEKPSLLFPLLSAIDCNEFDQGLLSNLVSKQVNLIKEAIFIQPLWFTQHSVFIASLLEKHLEKKLKKKLYTDIKSQWNNIPQQSSALELLKAIVSDGSDVVDFMAKLLLWLTEALDNSSFDEYIWLYDGVADIVSSKKKETSWRKLLELENFNHVMRTSLKWGLRHDKTCCEHLMKMLVALSQAIYSDDDKDRVVEFFNLLISHSDFISVMLDNNDFTYQVVELLLILLKVNPKLTKSSHVPIYLSAYGATMSKTDQKILELLQFYENNGSSVWEWRPCLWGPSAANFYSVHSKSAQPLWRQPRMSQVLDLLDKDLVDTTICKFPLKRSLQADVHIIFNDGGKIYDPAFILPLLTHLLAEGADVQHRSMVNSGALAIVLASLGSTCIDLRSVGYLVLTRFHSHLSSGENDQQLWLNFINAIRGGVLELQHEYPQIATIIATFLAQASLVLSLPQHPLFTVLHNFLLAKPALNLTSIPAFLELLQSKDVQHSEHQEWMLKVLRDGTRQKIDMKLLFQSLAFKILMTLYSFVHTPKELRILIIETFTSCIAIQDAGYVLVTNYGLISWISHCLMSNDYDEVSSLIKFLEKLSYFKSCSLHIKLIAVHLASNVTTVGDIEIILKILSNNKVIGYLNQDDIKTLINMVMSQLGTDAVRKSNDMMNYGCDYVSDLSDSNVTVCALNKLVYDWLCKR